jgi:hypothetical protein
MKVDIYSSLDFELCLNKLDWFSENGELLAFASRTISQDWELLA